MVRRSLEPWLAHVLQDEISAVLHWWKSRTPGIKPDPDSRFHNDWSNFRSEVTASSTDNRMVQLIEVLSVEKSPRVVLSDGQRKIKARLSEEALATLEAEIGEKFNSDVTGDVFQLQTFTVTSTHLGVSDDSVTLSVDDIEYAHHLRRNHGNPTPIEEDPDIALCITAMKELRSSAEEQPDTEEEPSIHGQPSDMGHSTTIPMSSELPETQDRNPALQSQHPVRRKAFGPSLNKDGFTIETGLNLELPYHAMAGLSRSDQLPGEQPKNPGTGRQKHLSSLLGPPKSAKSRQPIRHDLPQQSTDVVAETPIRSNNLAGQSVSRANPSANSETRPTKDAPMSPAIERPPKKTPSSAQFIEVSSSSLRSSGASAVGHGKRKIPAAQRKLLDHPSSWIPSLPGQRFPHPNVPIELLKAWNKSATKTPSPRKSGPVKSGGLPTTTDFEHRPSSSNMSIEEDSPETSDEELPESQWPPTPTQPNMGLPPDSSLGADDDLRVAAPRVSTTRKPTIQHQEDRLSQPPLRHPLPPRPLNPEEPSPQFSTQQAATSHMQSSPQSVRSQISPTQHQQSQTTLSRSQIQLSSPSAPNSQLAGRKRPNGSLTSDLEAARRESPARPAAPDRHTNSRDVVDSRIPSYRHEPEYDRRPRSRDSYHPSRDDSRDDYRSRGGDSYIPSYRHEPEYPRRPPSRDSYNRGRRDSRDRADASRSNLAPRGSISDSSRRGPRPPSVPRRSFEGVPSTPDPRKAITPSSQAVSGKQYQTSGSVPLSQWQNPPMVGRRSLLPQKSPSNVEGRRTDGRSPPVQHSPSSRGDITDKPAVASAHNHLHETSRPTNPDEIHRQTRRSFVQRQKRIEWVQNQCRPSPAGPYNVQTLLTRYRTAHKEDTIAAPEFLDVLRAAFPAARLTLATLFCDQKGEVSHSVADEDGQIHNSRPRSSPQLAGGPGSEPGDETHDAEMEETNDSDPLRYFCENWRRLRPGGAFARPPSGRPARRTVNVLKWDI